MKIAYSLFAFFIQPLAFKRMSPRRPTSTPASAGVSHCVCLLIKRPPKLKQSTAHCAGCLVCETFPCILLTLQKCSHLTGLDRCCCCFGWLINVISTFGWCGVALALNRGAHFYNSLFLGFLFDLHKCPPLLLGSGVTHPPVHVTINKQ